MVSKKVTRKVSKRAAAPAGAEVPPQGRRFDDAQRKHALVLVASGMSRVQVAATIGTTTESLRRWVKEAAVAGTTPPVAIAKAAPARATTAAGSRPSAPARSPYAPADPAQGLSDPEVAAILEWKKKHPSMGPAQLRAQLKRFMGWRLSIKAIARVLRGHGYAVVHTKARPVGPEPVRFEAPRRNALWQADFCEVRVGDERLHALLLLDDYSRFIVGHALTDSPSSAVVTATFRAAMARHGKPEAVRTDRGGAFVAYTKDGDFGRVLEAELVDHIVGRSYSPRGGGKVESAIGTLKRELWECFHFEDRGEAERRLTAFVEDYNHRRAHMGIDGLVPADRFFGRADQVLARIDALSRGRIATLAARHGDPGAPVEEILPASTGAPLEVLRLVLHDGVMELRFCGARVQLGPLMT
ncbi:MAG: DDE-type integrase/transposase/recombinase [Polyangiaceae bacterium]